MVAMDEGVTMESAGGSLCAHVIEHEMCLGEHVKLHGKAWRGLKGVCKIT